MMKQYEASFVIYDLVYRSTGKLELAKNARRKYDRAVLRSQMVQGE